MTILEQVRRLIERLAPAPVCDECIAQRLGLGIRQHASSNSRELGGRDGFERRKDECALCGATRPVIRKGAR